MPVPKHFVHTNCSGHMTAPTCPAGFNNPFLWHYPILLSHTAPLSYMSASHNEVEQQDDLRPRWRRPPNYCPGRRRLCVSLRVSAMGIWRLRGLGVWGQVTAEVTPGSRRYPGRDAAAAAAASWLVRRGSRSACDVTGCVRGAALWLVAGAAATEQLATPNQLLATTLRKVELERQFWPGCRG